MYKHFKYALAFFFFAGMLVTSSYYLISAIEEKYIDQQETTLKTISTATKSTLKNWKNQVQGEFSLWLNSPVIYSFIDSEFENKIDKWLSVVLPFISADAVYFSDTNGVVVSRSDGSIPNNVHSIVFQSSKKLLAGESVTNIVNRATDSGLFDLVFSFPLSSFDDDIVGYAHFNLRSDNKFSEILNTVQFGKTGGVLAVSGSGIRITNNGSKQDVTIKYSVPRYKEVDSAIKNIDRKNELWTEYYSWSKDLECWILIEIKYDEFFNIFGFIKNLVIIFCGIVCLIVLFVFSQFIYFSDRKEMSNLIYKNSFFESTDLRIVLDVSGGIVDWSKSADDLFGISSEKILNIKDINISNIDDEIKKLGEKIKVRVFDFSVGIKTFTGSVKILKNDRDKFILIEGKDITRQIESSNSIKEKEERLRTTMQATNQGYFDLNFNSGIEYFDVSLIEMLGYSGGVTVNRATLDSLIHPDDFHKVVEMNTDVFGSDSNKMISCEARMRTKENKWRYILMKSKVITRDSEGRVARVVGAHTDITRSKRSELLLSKEKKSVTLLNIKLEQAAKAKDQFISTMSHELRTPLNAIISLSDLLLTETVDGINDKQTGYIEVIERSGKHLLDIINDILDISKINSGEMKLSLTKVNIDKEVAGAIKIVSSLALAKGIEIKFGNIMSKEDILLDAKRFRQILLNLLSNAIKFTDNNKSIGVNCSNTNTKFTLEVWDEGIGVSKENIDKLFKPFVQIDSELSRSQEGTGLGLSLVKNMVELHGGEIEVESKKGVGTSLNLIFPIKVVEQEDKGSSPVFI